MLASIVGGRSITGMNNARSISAKLSHATRRTFREAATTIPADVVAKIKARAVEGVDSGEPHKVTGGWVVYPFNDKGYRIVGLLEIARLAIREAQSAKFTY